MEKFAIFASNFLIIVFSSIINIDYLSQQQFSAFKLAQYKWNSPNTHFYPMPAKVPSRNSRPLTKISTSLNNCQFKRKILHQQIILFSNNSFAILSIPYSQFKNMSRQTSSRQIKKDRKATNTQVKIAAAKSTKFIPTAALKTVVEHVSNTSDLNRMDRQEPQTLANTALVANAQAKKKHKAFQELFPTAGNNRSVELCSRNASNLANINHWMEKNLAPLNLNRRNTQEPEVPGINAPSTAIPTPRIQHGSKISKLLPDTHPANASLIRNNQRNIVRQLIRGNSSQYLRKQSINPAVMTPTGISSKRRSIGNLEQQIFMQSYGPNSAPNSSAHSNLRNEINSAIMIPAATSTTLRPIKGFKQKSFMESYGLNFAPSPSANKHFSYKIISAAIPIRRRPNESFPQQFLMQFNGPGPHLNSTANTNRTAAMEPETTVKLYNRYTLIATFAHIKLTYPSILPFPYLLRNLNPNLLYTPQDYRSYTPRKYCSKLKHLNTLVSTTLVNYRNSLSTQVERPKAVGVPTTSKYDVTHTLKVPTTLLTTPNPTDPMPDLPRTARHYPYPQRKRLESTLARHACKSPHYTPTPTPGPNDKSSDKPSPAMQPTHLTTPHTIHTMPIHIQLTTRPKKPQPHRTCRPPPTPKPNDPLHPLTPTRAMSRTTINSSHPISTNIPHEPHPPSAPPPFQRNRQSITDLPAERQIADREQVSDSSNLQILTADPTPTQHLQPKPVDYADNTGKCTQTPSDHSLTLTKTLHNTSHECHHEPRPTDLQPTSSPSGPHTDHPLVHPHKPPPHRTCRPQPTPMSTNIPHTPINPSHSTHTHTPI